MTIRRLGEAARPTPFVVTNPVAHVLVGTEVMIRGTRVATVTPPGAAERGLDVERGAVRFRLDKPGQWWYVVENASGTRVRGVVVATRA